MTDNRTTELSEKLTAEQVREAVMSADRWKKPMGNTGLTNTHLIIRDDGWQAIADELNVTLGSERELIDLAHNAWSMALCAMKGMPIPAEWGNAVERGLRKHGIDVDGELAGFEVVDE